MKSKFTTYHICMIALAIVINIVGGQIALLLRLPIYLDSIGTIFIAAVCGPFYGMLPSLLSGLIFGMTSDPYALYYAPVGILLGFLVGAVWKCSIQRPMKVLFTAFLVTVPTSFVSALITSFVFGGITSSGSSYLVLAFSKMGMSLMMSSFLVQLGTDYLDRVLSMFLVLVLLKKFPAGFLNKLNSHKG